MVVEADWCPSVGQCASVSGMMAHLWMFPHLHTLNTVIQHHTHITPSVFSRNEVDCVQWLVLLYGFLTTIQEDIEREVNFFLVFWKHFFFFLPSLGFCFVVLCRKYFCYSEFDVFGQVLQ